MVVVADSAAAVAVVAAADYYLDPWESSTVIQIAGKRFRCMQA
jgi:hypothetical protein